MRILYGVVGEGMGHATRSRVVVEHLLAAGHELHLVVSGRAHHFLTERLADEPRVRIDEIHGLVLRFEGNAVDKSETFLANLSGLPAGVLKNIAAYEAVAEADFDPQLVISDFESWAFLYALNHRLPVVSIDNMQVLNRCRHDDEVTAGGSRHFKLAKWLVKAKLPGAYHYLVSSFFFPEVKKPRTTLVPPILRPEVISAVREPGDHVLVYQTAANNDALIPTLRSLPGTFRVYGMGREGVEGNVTLCAFSETGFVDDLRTARAVIAGGGYSLMGEAMHLRVPMLSVPLAGQFEQVLNARYLEKEGYGAWSPHLDADVVRGFLERTAAFTDALLRYPAQDNSLLFACVDELVRHVSLDEPPPDRLETQAMGSY